MLWSDFLLSVSSVSCFGSLPFASDFLQWGSQAAKWELKLPNIWVCSCCSCCDTARLESSLPLRSFSQADPLLPAWDLCCAWWQIFSSSPCNFEWSYTLLHTLYKVKAMCQTWMILTTGYHQTQSPVPEQHRWQLPPKISTHILQELQLFHSYLAMLLGYPSLIPSNYILATCSCMISRVMRCELGLLLCAIGFVTDFAKLHVNRVWAWRFSQKGACSMMQRGRKDCEASWELEVIFATVWMCLSGFLGLGMNLK